MAPQKALQRWAGRPTPFQEDMKVSGLQIGLQALLPEAFLTSGRLTSRNFSLVALRWEFSCHLKIH